MSDDEPRPDDGDEWGEPVQGQPRRVDAVFSVRVDRELADRLRGAARDANVPTSQFIREALRAWLDLPPAAQPSAGPIMITSLSGSPSYYSDVHTTDETVSRGVMPVRAWSIDHRPEPGPVRSGPTKE